MHALGVYHQQSRPDRDSFVRINWGNILQGREHNFQKLEDSQVTTGGTPYSYRSVMHYSRTVSASLSCNHLCSNRVYSYLTPVIRINVHALWNQNVFKILVVKKWRFALQAFSKDRDNLDTITTYDPAFQDIIGRARTFSFEDIQILNQLYPCMFLISTQYLTYIYRSNLHRSNHIDLTCIEITYIDPNLHRANLYGSSLHRANLHRP